MVLKTKPSLLLVSLLVSAYLLLSTCGVDQQETVAIDEDVSAESGQSVATQDIQMAQDATTEAASEASPDPTSARNELPASPVSQPVKADRPAYPPAIQPSSPQVDIVASMPPPRAQPQPIPLTVVAGQTLDIEFRQTLSSHTSQPGQAFRARVTEPVRVGEKVAIPAGATIHGTVTEAEPAKKIGGRARLSLEFESLSLASGATYPIGAIFSQAGRSQNAKDAAIIGGATLGGAVLGKQVGGDTGTIIGAVAGGIGGAFAAKKTKGKPVEIPAGTVMILELTQPVTIDVLP